VSLLVLPLGLGPRAARADTSPTPAQSAAPTATLLLPEHLTPEAVAAAERGLAFLARTQSPNGSWAGNADGQRYPVSMTALAGMAFLANGNTTTRGPYAETVRKTVRYLLTQVNDNGLIAGAGDNGRPMYGHGFSLLFLASAYGMETDTNRRNQMHDVIERAITMTGQAQSDRGGWTYSPNSGDEGSVTVTQMQALRACQNAGFTVPPAIIEDAIGYLEACRTPEGGIRYSYSSGNSPRLPISAAAITCLYMAGEFESDMADAALEYVFGQFQANAGQWSKRGGHDYYAHYYASQSFYQAGDEYWDAYFPVARDQLLELQHPNGSWTGDGVGPTYGTAIACTMLQIPYRFVPIYQR
jgi:squalene cyclase